MSTIMYLCKNKNSIRVAILSPLILALLACGGRAKQDEIDNYSVVSSERMTFATDERQEPEPSSREEFPTKTNDIPSPQKLSRHQVLRALNAQHREWRGVRYQIGGMTKRGIDCSRFVHITFQSHFNVELPKNTEAQLAFARAITRRDLEVGDLVFFKTGWRTNHVGIYLKDDLFLHASATKGVTISRLSNRYWAKRYWRSVRVLHPTEQLSDSRYQQGRDSFNHR